MSIYTFLALYTCIYLYYLSISTVNEYIFIYFKEFLLNTTKKFSLLAQAFTKIYTLHFQGNEFRKRRKIHAVNSYIQATVIK